MILQEISRMILDSIVNNFGGITIIMVMCTFWYLIYRAHQAQSIDWSDLIRAKGSNAISLTKFLQLIGGVTGTWMVVYTTLHDKLTFDLLLVYLTYVGAIDAWSKFISARYGGSYAPPPVEDEKEHKKDITKTTSE